MSYIIALAGKGGVGKTSIAALIVKYLLKNNKTPILALDADPNSNFAESIGINIDDTIGSVLADFLKNRGELPPGMTKQSFLDLKLHQILKEGKNIDMMAMGAPEGPGCYCAANSILKDYFEKLATNYKYIVIDNEAGMEHFSRKNNSKIDLLIMCSNYSLKGIKTAKRLSDLVDALGLEIKERVLIVNQTPEQIDQGILEEIKKTGLQLMGSIVSDNLIEEFEINGKALTELPDDTKAYRSIEMLLNKYIN
ncbi:MAG: AAA family ATPase [Spirochaetes bacterium]|nr:AAA family ATPase [Spirochaetota bacterium]